jgi:hypothetical protein
MPPAKSAVQSLLGGSEEIRCASGVALDWSIWIAFMEITYAYLAGVIDIYGVISIQRRMNTRLGQPYYFATVSLSDTSPVVPELLHALFPSSLQQSRPRNESYSPFWVWRVDHQQARQPLLRLLPHLRLKRRQAELALALIDFIDEQSVGRPFTKRLGAEQHEIRSRLYEEVTRLNAARGPRKHRPRA